MTPTLVLCDTPGQSYYVKWTVQQDGKDKSLGAIKTGSNTTPGNYYAPRLKRST